MAAIKPLETSADKWNRRAQQAGPDYSQGIDNPRQSWSQAAAAGDANYRQAVTAAATAGRFAAGVRKAGDERWRAMAKAKGPTRFAEGVTLAVGEWQKGFQPYQTTVGSLTLPARGPTGSAANLQRVAAVANALRAVKMRTSGGAA
jgi:hypothetical protein